MQCLKLQNNLITGNLNYSFWLQPILASHISFSPMEGSVLSEGQWKGSPMLGHTTEPDLYGVRSPVVGQLSPGRPLFYILYMQSHM